MKKYLVILSIIAGLVSLSPSFAALDLELTQGYDGAIPIAVVPFGGESSTNENAIASVIASDLSYCGRFRVMPSSKMTQRPSTVQSVDKSVWQELGMDNLVIGKIERSGQKIHVSYQLIDIYGRAGVLLDKTFAGNDRDQRSLAHHISDQIYQQLIGKKGFFSTHIAYILVENEGKPTRHYNLVVADADGYNPQKLLSSKEPIMSPRWSSDGRQLAYVSFEGQRSSIYIQNVANGSRHVVASFSGINGAPAWSPDNSKLAVVLSKTGVPKIYVLNLANNQVSPITDGYSIDTEPRWSPDGKNILFTSNRSGGPQIYQVSVWGGAAKRVTFNGNYNASGVYTPDGKSIVLLHQDNGVFSIARLDLGTHQFDILTDTTRDQSPSVAPNGDMLLYATRHEGRQVLGMVSIDGRIQLRLPAQEGEVREPAWSTI
jgi:TolB protein